jgi:prohibitin 2
VQNHPKTMSASTLAKLIGTAILIFIVIIAISSSSYVVEPGSRGVEVTLGQVSPVFKPQGFGFKKPFITTIVPVTIKQQTREVQASCFSSDLQQVDMDLQALYRVPESSVVQIYQGYAGDPFDSLIEPRVQEAMKEVTAMDTAEEIVKNREEIKDKALASARTKVGSLLVIEDVVIQNIDLSKQLEDAIEAKMVQEQEADKAKFVQQKAQIEADTVVITAKGEAEAMKIRGEALKENPNYLQLQIVEKWDGKSPLVVGSGTSGANMLLPMADLSQQSHTQQP